MSKRGRGNCLQDKRNSTWLSVRDKQFPKNNINIEGQTDADETVNGSVIWHLCAKLEGYKDADRYKLVSNKFHVMFKCKERLIRKSPFSGS